jgi:hypothetical protein
MEVNDLENLQFLSDDEDDGAPSTHVDDEDQDD